MAYLKQMSLVENREVAGDMGEGAVFKRRFSTRGW